MYRRINLAASPLKQGLFAISKTTLMQLCMPLSGAAALNVPAGTFTSPLSGTRWRIRLTVGPMGAACTLKLKARLFAGLPPSSESFNFPAGGGSFVSANQYLIPTGLTSNVAPGDQVKVEFEVVGVELAGNNALPIDGVVTSAEDVAQNEFAFLENKASEDVLVRIDPAETLVSGQDVVSAAGGLGRMKVMGDTGTLFGRNYSEAPIWKDGMTFASVKIDMREP